MAKQSSDFEASDHLYDRKPRKNGAARAVELTILLLLVSLLIYRLLSLKNHGSTWLVALACESWFTFIWVLVVNSKWSPVDFQTYPQRLLRQVKKEQLPAVDMFVTTADPVLEPPILTVNTVLSLLAVEYPGAAHRLACYVSDDACSSVTYYALTEASMFAQKWVPFCKKYKVEVRAPFRYFTAEGPPLPPPGFDKLEFQRAWEQMKEEYDQLCNAIETAGKSSLPSDVSTAFSNVDRRDHPSIVKVIWENKEGDPDGVPRLIYVSREKRPNHHHYYKAGAMNVLIRVSGILTNAPFMLNVDCDMYANNPDVVLHAMCILLDPKSENDIAFVQCPQQFYGGLKDDPFGNQAVVIFHYIVRGIAGIQGAFYAGTGCFHRRKVIYGAWPDTGKIIIDEKMMDESERFGRSEEFCRSASLALKGQSCPCSLADLSSLEAADGVASSSYENSTLWGKEVGVRYGSATEDTLTGLSIHAKGWRSAYCTLEPPPFLGCAPTGGSASLTQQKRWSTGFLEILVSKNTPIVTALFRNLQLRQCMGYLYFLLMNVRSIPELVYALIPPYCIITNTRFLPGSHDRATLILAALVIVYTGYSVVEYLRCGLSVLTWWNNHRMARITSACAWTCGSLAVVPKILGISETMFEVTKKEESPDSGEDEGGRRFTFDDSQVFVPGTVVLMVQGAALAVAALGLQPPAIGGGGSGFGEVVCALYLVLCFWPFVKGLVGRGKYGIPLATICKSAAIATVFVHFCRFSASVEV